MRWIIKLYKSIVRYFSNQGLLRKLTLAYTVAILIPTTVISFYTYRQSIISIKKEIAQNSQQSLAQIDESIERKILIITSIANNIAFNTKIQNQLYYGMEFNPETLKYFIEDIANPIGYALNFTEANIYQLRVYFENDSVPEYGHFYKQERIKDLEWFKAFRSSKKDEMWIYPAQSERFASNDINITSPVVKMIKSINSVDGKYLGVVVMDVKQEDIFSSLNVEDNYQVFAVSNGNNISYPKGIDSREITRVLENKDKSKGYFFDNDILYSYNTIEPLGVRIISKTPIKDIIRSSTLSSKYNVMAVILGGIVLEIITYYILKIIFSKMNQIVKIMNIVAKGNFNIRIPITHKDEVGEMATSFNILIEKINDLIKDVIKKETAQKDAQLIALQYQINPHFIYNTIDIFRMKLEIEGNYEMAESITFFGKMLRYNINQTSQYATIEQEVEYVERYIKLQKLRFKEKLRYEVRLPEELKDIKIIRFMLQPIVENSIKHGIKDSEQELMIQVKFKKKNDRLEIEVIDNGKGMSVEEVDKLNHRLKSSQMMDRQKLGDRNIGLDNINTRIKLFYGDQYYIKMESLEGEWTRAVVNIPYNID